MSEPFAKLVAVMKKLRGPEGCPWDREQTLASLRSYLLEETYEALEAIDSEDPEALREELGDLLLEVVFLSQVCAERGLFDIDDVASGIHDKLIRRHPHVFGDERASGAREAIGRWEAIKNQERRDSGGGSVLSGVPSALPALLRAFRISEKASMVGFDWEGASRVLDKVAEEVEELREAVRSGRKEDVEEELGDLLFAAANVGRVSGLDPEMALQAANRKFTRRFQRVERALEEKGLHPSRETREEMERQWDLAKGAEDQSTGST